MASKKHRPQAVAKLRRVDVLVSQGQTVAEAIRAIGVTYYRWRREFGGLKSDQVKRKRCSAARLPERAIDVLGLLEAESIELTLWPTFMTTRRAGW